MRSLVAPAVVLSLVAGSCASPDPEAGQQAALDPIVQTSAGTLVGSRAEGDTLAVFLGVPYARPPVGDLRWRPPQPVDTWEGTRDATTYSLPCWQSLTPKTSIYSRGDFERSEDCLYLNLWTPAAEGESGLPVMVWYHGGGHRTGHGNSPTFDGTAFAQRGVVLISVNYRLDHLGFLAHPALSAESEQGSSGNYGILDKVAALEWVRDNAAAFGGDPGNVTIFGQSAGSFSVCALMASPLAKGLFHKVIGHSGSCTGTRLELDNGTGPEGSGPTAHGMGLALAKELGIEGEGPDAAAALRATSPADILAAAASAPSPGLHVDGWVVPRQMGEIFAAGEHSNVPLVAGWLADEGKGLYFAMPDLTEEQVLESLTGRYGDRAEAVLAAYSRELAESPRTALQAIQGDALFGVGTRRWLDLASATGTPTYSYFFSHPAPAYLLYLPGEELQDAPAERRAYGAFHSGELAYAFGTQALFDQPWTDDDRAVSDAMQQYWVNFALTGDPNGEGLPEWPRYTRESPQTLELAAPIGVLTDVLKEKLDLLESPG